MAWTEMARGIGAGRAADRWDDVTETVAFSMLRSKVC